MHLRTRTRCAPLLTTLLAMAIAAHAQRISHNPRTAEPVALDTQATPMATPAPPLAQACKFTIGDNANVASANERKRAGQMALPPLTDTDNGFAWPDTELGVVRNPQDAKTYLFFGSDGGYHARQSFEDTEQGNNKSGSITRTIGTLDKILGTEPPVDVTIRPNPNPAVNPFYNSYDYLGGGPVYRVPAGKPGAGNLLMLYHAEIPTITTQSFYSVLALARSTDEGLNWTDLGEIIRVNQGYRTDMDGYDIGDPELVTSPDGKYFYVYFADWLANGTTHWLGTINFLSMARAPIDDVLSAAFNVEHPHALNFEKRYDGWNLNQALGGYSRDLFPAGEPYWGPLRVSWNAYIKRYQAFINNGNLIAYAESRDGITWSQSTVLKNFSKDPDQPGIYVTPVGLGDDPRVLGKEFYILYTYYPNDGYGWEHASVRRFTVTCH